MVPALLWTGLVSASSASLYEVAVNLQNEHGFGNDLLGGWQVRGELAAAVNQVYTYTLTDLSPPPLEVAHGATSLIACSATVCTVDAEQIEMVDSDTLFSTALVEILKSLGVESPASSVAGIAVSDFAFGDSRACVDNSGCGTGLECCGAAEKLPGICCNKEILNLHDTMISPAIVIVGVSVLGLLSIYWSFTCCQRLHRE